MAYSNDRYASRTTANTASVTAVMAMMSTHDTPKTLPNSTASMLLRAWPYRFNSAMPPAKLAVVTIPIAASAPRIFCRAIRPINTPETTPQMPAPTKKLIDITAEAAAPPKTACESPWPM